MSAIEECKVPEEEMSPLKLKKESSLGEDQQQNASMIQRQKTKS